MEENNNNVIIKGLAIILIAILGLNVYRTETTKKELSSLSETVQQVSARLDSLQVSEGGGAAASVGSNKQVSALTKKVSILESKLNTLQGTIDRLTKSSSSGSARVATAIGGGSLSGTATTAAPNKSGRASVSAKVKVENRYVQGTTYLPKVSTGSAGTVIVNVVLNRIGTVGSVSIDASSTISDEDILDACKEAALKTSFAYNPEAPDKSRGTITYTFTAK